MWNRLFNEYLKIGTDLYVLINSVPFKYAYISNYSHFYAQNQINDAAAMQMCVL